MVNLSVMAAILDDDKLFARHFIIIPDRHGTDVSFELNPAQEILYNNLSGRDLVLKARELGITTYLLARGFRRVLVHDNQTAVVVAHEEFITKQLLDRVRGMYLRLPIPDNFKPSIHHDSEFQISFPARRSKYYIGTAGAKVFGRGEPIHYFIGSEMAFWPKPLRILYPVMQTVPLDGEIILESTPNGEGSGREPNVFYTLVQEALEDPNSTWKLHTLPWWTIPDYSIPEGSLYALPNDRGPLSLNTDEEALARKLKWDDTEAYSRIRWRRRKQSELKANFWQEFFEDISSCFMSVQEPFYDYSLLDKWLKLCSPPISTRNNAQIWYEPVSIEDHPSYFISVDPGVGKNTLSVALVWRIDLDHFSTIRHEATLSGRYDPVSFAPLVKSLGYYYHNAKIAAESNGHGMAFCAQVLDYPNLYYRTDLVSGVESKQVGWLTTGATRIGSTGTKMYMMTQLQDMLPRLVTHDLELVRQLRQVRYSGDQVIFLGSDDYHDAAAIMAATIPGAMRASPGYTGRAGWKW